MTYAQSMISQVVFGVSIFKPIDKGPIWYPLTQTWPRCFQTPLRLMKRSVS